MAILDILKEPNEVLRQLSKPIASFDSDLQKLLDDMLETMHSKHGIGIAAIQVGQPLRVLIVQIEPEMKPLFIINPEVIELFEPIISLPEGCLSVNKEDIIADSKVRRPIGIHISYFDRDGQEQELLVNPDKSDYENKRKKFFDDLWMARCLQHELDHLNGKLFIDYSDNANHDF